MTNTVTTKNAVPRGVVVLFAVTAVAITVTLALGSTVCATECLGLVPELARLLCRSSHPVGRYPAVGRVHPSRHFGLGGSVRARQRHRRHGVSTC